MWKTHVAPVKTTSLPRLELMVAVTATKLAQFGYSSIVTKQPIAFGLAAKLCYTGYIRETTLNRSFLIALRRYVKPFNQSIGHSHCQAITQLTYLKGTYLTITWETYELYRSYHSWWYDDANPPTTNQVHKLIACLYLQKPIQRHMGQLYNLIVTVMLV